MFKKQFLHLFHYIYLFQNIVKKYIKFIFKKLKSRNPTLKSLQIVFIISGRFYNF